jgi:hypothetical protein
MQLLSTYSKIGGVALGAVLHRAIQRIQELDLIRMGLVRMALDLMA